MDVSKVVLGQESRGAGPVMVWTTEGWLLPASSLDPGVKSVVHREVGSYSGAEPKDVAWKGAALADLAKGDSWEDAALADLARDDSWEDAELADLAKGDSWKDAALADLAKGDSWKEFCPSKAGSFLLDPLHLGSRHHDLGQARAQLSKCKPSECRRNTIAV